jgi:hypothetical protein
MPVVDRSHIRSPTLTDSPAATRDVPDHQHRHREDVGLVARLFFRRSESEALVTPKAAQHAAEIRGASILQMTVRGFCLSGGDRIGRQIQSFQPVTSRPRSGSPDVPRARD